MTTRKEQKEWREKNKEHWKEYTQNYREKNKEHITKEQGERRDLDKLRVNIPLFYPKNKYK